MDKRYYYLNTCLEQLHSEGWQYIELSGKYSGFHIPNAVPTHANQFVFFCHAIEKIRMKQVEEEYFKLIDAQNTPPKPSVDSLVPPTPLKEDFKRMMAQFIDSPIVNGNPGQADWSPEPVSIQPIVPSAINEGKAVLPPPPGQIAAASESLGASV
jgi:hypothetical protein